MTERPRTGRLLATGAPVVVTSVGVWVLTEAAAPWWACVALTVVMLAPAVVAWRVSTKEERIDGR